MSTLTDQEPALLTLAELAEVVLRRPDPESSAARHAVWKLCRMGMPYIAAAGARLFSLSDCLAWLARRAEAAAAAREQSAELAAMVAQQSRSTLPPPAKASRTRRSKSASKSPSKSLAELARSIRSER